MSLTKRIPEVLGLVAALVLAGGCDTLNVKNPNAPDTGRALGDPGTVQAIAAGALRTWYNTTQNMDPVAILITQANSHTASWNNFQIRFYSGCTSGPPPTYGTCGTTSGTYPRTSWQNNPAAAERLQIEVYWYGYYSALSSVADVLRAIRQNGLVITDAKNTKMVETMAVLVQALALSQLALNYDKAFIVTDSTPRDPTTNAPIVTLKSRTALRDTAVAKFDQAIALAPGMAPVPTSFFNDPGIEYDSVRIRKIANTMAARTLAYFPRTAAENALVDWATVATYASKGMSSGAPADAFDVVFKHDGCVNWCDYLKAWSNDLTTMRMHTRVSNLLDPLSQETPYPIRNVRTTLVAPITGSGSAQSVTPDTMLNITTGRQLAIGGVGVVIDTVSIGPPLNTDTTTLDEEDRFVVTATTPTTFTAVVTNNHPATTLASPITKGAAPQAATPVSMAGIQKASVLSIEDSLETVTVKSVTATTFTAVFSKDHPAGAVVGAPVTRQGNPQPSRTSGSPLSSPDQRLGDGSYGSGSFALNVTKTPPETPNAGTDYAWSTANAIFPAARGSWHQSAIGQTRYINLSGIDPNGSAFGFGPGPVVLAAENDLLWAEGLIRSGGNLVLAADKINNSRVTRGGLSPAPSAAGLLADLQYEQDIELPGSNAAPFYNLRRIDQLEPFTAREMPVPAKELGVLGMPLYTWGGASPPNSGPTAPVPALSAQNLQRVWAEMEQRLLMPGRTQGFRK
jgi:hypothetical protein